MFKNESEIKRYIRTLNDKIHGRLFMNLDSFKSSIEKEIQPSAMYEWNGNLIPMKNMCFIHAETLKKSGVTNFYDTFLHFIYPD